MQKLGPVLTLSLDQFLTSKPPNLGPAFNFTLPVPNGKSFLIKNFQICLIIFGPVFSKMQWEIVTVENWGVKWWQPFDLSEPKAVGRLVWQAASSKPGAQWTMWATRLSKGGTTKVPQTALTMGIGRSRRAPLTSSLTFPGGWWSMTSARQP